MLLAGVSGLVEKHCVLPRGLSVSLHRGPQAAGPPRGQRQQEPGWVSWPRLDPLPGSDSGLTQAPPGHALALGLPAGLPERSPRATLQPISGAYLLGASSGVGVHPPWLGPCLSLHGCRHSQRHLNSFLMLYIEKASPGETSPPDLALFLPTVWSHPAPNASPNLHPTPAPRGLLLQ